MPLLWLSARLPRATMPVEIAETDTAATIDPVCGSAARLYTGNDPLMMMSM
ncbi:MAG: hypothetical protein JF566_07330 [Bradyrhizobium sp.]|nr:hypothetical protein [Bradyrhizobium sp.]